MTDLQFNFNKEQFNHLFPFYILIDKHLKVISIGKSLQKIYSIPLNSLFTDIFSINRPETIINQFSDFAILKEQLTIIELKNNDTKVVLRGQFDFLSQDDCYLFVGTPWFSSMDQVRFLNLTLNDFALHDPMIDLLNVLNTQETTNEEIKLLLRTVNQQKNRLKQSEANYRSIIEQATEIIYRVNANGDFIFVNEVAERITGYSKEELLTINFSQFIRDDFKEPAVKFYRNQVIDKIPTTYFEFPIITKQGEEIWIGQSVQFPQNTGSSIELTAMAININKRKHAEQNLILQEEKYRNIIANMNLGLLEVDREDIIQHANQSFCNMSGYLLEELIGKKASGLFTEDIEKELILNKNETRKAGISDMYSVPVKNKNGEKRWWVISGAPRYNDNGDLLGSVGIHLDITEQKHLEEELKIAKLKAEDSSKAKESFLATMSHEIRTPLNAIVGITDLMQLDPKLRNKENLDTLSFSAKNLLALITDILDLTKIDAGKIQLSNNKIDLKQLINGIFQTFRPACEEKNIELILNVNNSVPDIIIGDELRLSQILNNLISNAVKFTPKGFVKINVDSKPISNDKIRLLFKIFDSGIGLKKSKIESIFNAFEQADKSIVRQFGGTGLGLNITKKLIELQGGSINVESKLNIGSVFSFYIDYEVAKTTKKEQENKNRSNTQKNFKPIDKIVLLVEDNIANQKVAVSYLSHWGLQWEIANNGREALDLLRNKSYDLAIIDLFMPIMDGFETIKRIRKNKELNNLPLIALTASAEISLMDKAVTLGADRCLTKPFNSQQLHDTIFGFLSNEINLKTSSKKPRQLVNSKKHYKYINLKKLEEASLGSTSFIAEMIEILGREIPTLLEESATLLANSDMLNFSQIIHKMKGSILLLGMDMLKEDLIFLEESSKQSNKIAEIIPRYEALNKFVKNAFSEIEAAKIQYSV